MIGQILHLILDFNTLMARVKSSFRDYRFINVLVITILWRGRSLKTWSSKMILPFGHNRIGSKNIKTKANLAASNRSHNWNSRRWDRIQDAAYRIKTHFGIWGYSTLHHQPISVISIRKANAKITFCTIFWSPEPFFRLSEPTAHSGMCWEGKEHTFPVSCSDRALTLFRHIGWTRGQLRHGSCMVLCSQFCSGQNRWHKCIGFLHFEVGSCSTVGLWRSGALK